MAPIEDVTKILKRGIRFGAVGRVSGKQIDEAADQILKSSSVTRELLEQIGRELAGETTIPNQTLPLVKSA